MPSMIGLIMLMGIATKNSILLVDYAIMARREHGHEPRGTPCSTPATSARGRS
jgi:multidrug efflux pump subunit AcrB